MESFSFPSKVIGGNVNFISREGVKMYVLWETEREHRMASYLN